MFGKRQPQTPAAPPKPAPAAAPAQPSGWLVQALTNDYVAEGYLAPLEMPMLGYVNMTTQAAITFSPARLTALEPQAFIATDTPPEISIVKTTLIALVPGDEASLASARAQMPGRTLPALLYAGPYVIRAMIGMMGDMPLRHLFNTGVGNFVTAADVEVRCQRLGTAFGPLVAPLALLNKTLIQLYHPAV